MVGQEVLVTGKLELDVQTHHIRVKHADDPPKGDAVKVNPPNANPAFPIAPPPVGSQPFSIQQRFITVNIHVESLKKTED